MEKFIPLFITIAGYIVGLGAVTVIDLHGFLAQKSRYWTEATIRSHKITKPLIWLGIFLVLIGETLFYTGQSSSIQKIQYTLVGVLILNGIFLSFIVSPSLLKQEKDGNADQLLPQSLQNKIIISFIISFLGWWTKVGLLVWTLVN